jgi:phosphonate transport system substrate-binding protein
MERTMRKGVTIKEGLPVVLFVFVLWPVAAVQAEQPSPSLEERGRTIIVGRVSGNPKKHFVKLETMAGYLARRLRDVGIRQGTFVVAKDGKDMIRLLREGRIDVLSETAFSAIHFTRRGGAEILLREWKKGIAEYRTVFFTQKASAIRSLADLRGKVIAFEDPVSTSGFMFPAAILRRRGYTLELVAPGAKVRAGRVGYTFATEEINIAVRVERRLADAGAFSSQDWQDVLRTPTALRKNLVPFHTSPPLPRSIILVRGGLPVEVKRRLKQILLAMNTTPEGRKMLKVYNRVKKYDAFDGPAMDGLELARSLYPLVEEAIR